MEINPNESHELQLTRGAAWKTTVSDRDGLVSSQLTSASGRGRSIRASLGLQPGDGGREVALRFAQASTKTDDRDYLDDDSASDSEMVNGPSPVHRHHASSPAATSSKTRGKDEGRTLMAAAAPEVTFVAEKQSPSKTSGSKAPVPATNSSNNTARNSSTWRSVNQPITARRSANDDDDGRVVVRTESDLDLVLHAPKRSIVGEMRVACRCTRWTIWRKRPCIILVILLAVTLYAITVALIVNSFGLI